MWKICRRYEILDKEALDWYIALAIFNHELILFKI